MSGNETITDAVVAGSAAGELEDSIRASRRKKRNRQSAFETPTPAGICSNCETKLAGPVCHSCGQTADTYHRPIWELILEILDGLLGFEGRMWRTLPPLLFKPGKITRQYLSGVRARYVMPFRLYLTASVLFFLLAFSFSGLGSDLIETENADGVELAESVNTETIRDQLEQAGLSGDEAGLIVGNIEDSVEAFGQVADDPVVRAAQQDAWKAETIQGMRRALLPEDYPDEEDDDGADAGNPDRTVVELDDGLSVSVDDPDQLPYEFRLFIADQAEAIINDGGEDLIANMQRWTPTLMFIMLPIYALLLAVTHFYKRGYFFYDHLVVSLHFHAFLFFFFSILILLNGTIVAGWMGELPVLILIIWSNYYLYRLHRSVYRHGRFSSALRTLFLDFVYAIILSVGALLLVVVGVITL